MFIVVSAGDSPAQGSGRLSKELQGHYNFMTEIFHLTQRALNVGYLPAVSHFKKLQQ